MILQVLEIGAIFQQNLETDIILAGGCTTPSEKYYIVKLDQGKNKKIVETNT